MCYVAVVQDKVGRKSRAKSIKFACKVYAIVIK